MVTYDEIFEAFCRFAASRDQSDWCDLWILCQRRMEALVKTKAKKLTIPLSHEDIEDLITDSTMRVMRKLQTAADIDPGYISKTFWFENYTAFQTFNQYHKHIRREEEFVKILNEFF